MSKVKVIDKCLPVINFTDTAYKKMQIYIDKSKEEVGWLCTATHSLNKQGQMVITIEDTMLFEQEVTSVETEITDEGMNALANELLQQEDGMERWNSIKAWGHSHVDMGTTPSGQDESQMELFSEHGHEWFIRIIANKKNHFKVDLYRYDLGIIYEDLPVTLIVSIEKHNLQKEIDELQSKMDQLDEDMIKMLEEPIEKELKEKVSKRSYVSKSKGSYYGVSYDRYKGYYDANEFYNNTNQKKTEQKEEEEEVIDGTVFIRSDRDVYDYFDKFMLLEIAESCGTWHGVEDYMVMMGYGEDYFDESELRIIYEVAVKDYVAECVKEAK